MEDMQQENSVGETVNGTIDDGSEREEVDEAIENFLVSTSETSKEFRNALADANLRTLRSALAVLKETSPEDVKEISAVERQIAKLEKASEPTTDKREFGETHKVLFTREQVAQHASDLARCLPEIERIESELASVKSQFKSKIEEQQARAKKLSAYVRDGFWFTDVRVRIIKNYRTGTYTKMRLDTGEVLETRALYPEERQRALGLK